MGCWADGRQVQEHSALGHGSEDKEVPGLLSKATAECGVFLAALDLLLPCPADV